MAIWEVKILVYLYCCFQNETDNVYRMYTFVLTGARPPNFGEIWKSSISDRNIFRRIYYPIRLQGFGNGAVERIKFRTIVFICFGRSLPRLRQLESLLITNLLRKTFDKERARIIYKRTCGDDNFIWNVAISTLIHSGSKVAQRDPAFRERPAEQTDSLG